MKIGKITSSVGGEIVASSQIPKKLEIKEAREIIELPVYLEDSRKAQHVGKIRNIIGRIDNPYFVISPSRKSPLPQDKLINKFIYCPHIKP